MKEKGINSMTSMDREEWRRKIKRHGTERSDTIDALYINGDNKKYVFHMLGESLIK